MEERTQLRVLLIDAQPQHAADSLRVTALVEGFDLQVEWCQSHDDAFRQIRSGLFDVVILDQRRDGESGFDLMPRGAEAIPRIATIILTSGAPSRGEREAAGIGAVDLIQKSHLTPGSLGEILRAAMQRQSAQAEWLAIQSFYRAAIDALRDHVAILDANGRILEVNAAWRDFAHANGVRQGEVNAGANYLEVCDRAAQAGDTVASEVAAELRALLKGSVTEVERTYPCHGPAEERWFRLRATTFCMGSMPFAVVVHENVTAAHVHARERETRLAAERNAADEKRALEERFVDVGRALPDGLMVFRSMRDESGQIVDFVWEFVNPAAERLAGRSRAQLLGHRLLDVMPGNVDEGLFAGYVGVVESGESLRREVRYTHEGLDFVVRLVATRVGDGFAVVFSDCTQEHHARAALVESEQRLRLVLESTSDAIWDFRLDRGEAFFSDQYFRMLGYVSGEVDLSLNRWHEHVHPYDVQRVLQQVEAHLSGKTQRYRAEYRVRAKTGEWRWLVARGRVVARDADGTPQRIIGTCTDITERRLLSKALEHERTRLASLFENAPAFMCVLRGREHVFELVNRAYLDLVGHRELIGRPAAEAIPEAVDGPFKEMLDGVLATGVAAEGKALPIVLHRTAGGPPEERIVDFVYQPMVESDGTISGVFVHGVDVTDRARSAHAIAESEARYRALFDANPEPTWVFDEESLRFLAVNEAALRRYGYEREEFLSLDLRDIRPPEEIPGLMEDLSRPAADRSPGLRRHRRKDGTDLYMEVSAQSINFENRRARLAVAHDVTDKLRAEREIRERSEALEHAVEGISRLGLDGRFLAVNRAFARMFGAQPHELIARRWEPTVEPDSLPKALEAYSDMLQSGAAEVEVRGRRLDGSTFMARLNLVAAHDDVGRISGHHCLAKDITQERSLEDQLRQAQKIEAVGRLAGGVAHDFNNILTVLKIHADFLAEAVDTNDPLREDVDEIGRATERAAGLTRQLLAFSRRQIMRPVTLDLSVAIKDLEKMLRRLIGEDITIETSLATDLGAVMADPSQIEQVIVNLVVNARDAITGGGTITISTSNVTIADGVNVGETAMGPGEYVRLRVSDTGCGMSPEVQSRIFEPFFTTKEPGQGTGLGLPTVYGIVKQSHGYIDVTSSVGAGSSIEVFLPRTAPAGADEAIAGSQHMPGGRETILLVEDEDGVRGLTRRILIRQGYLVLDAPNGRAALALAERYDAPIHLVLSDAVMPEMGGGELVRRLLQSRPNIGVLIMSGYTDDEMIRSGVQTSEVAFLQKPFSPAELAQQVRNVLDAARDTLIG